MHLVELSEQSAAISLVQRSPRDGMPIFNNKGQWTEQVVAFKVYQQLQWRSWGVHNYSDPYDVERK
jgi:hypothetical protein